jgi:hypothetical protein
MKNFRCFILLLLFAFPIQAAAQDNQNYSLQEQQSGNAGTEEEDIQGTLFDYINNLNELELLEMDPEQVDALSTLFFTKWQHALLQEAREGYTTRPPDSTDASGSVVKGPREISLGGIVYSNKDKWVVWLNKQRVTPDALPREVMDLQVSTDFVELKWYDAYTNQIFPVRLRAHQRFNIDSRIFLPGAGIN